MEPKNESTKSPNVENFSDAERAMLLAEYQAAQSSAQHHDGLIWPATSIVWGANLVILGFILQNLSTLTLKPLTTLLCLLAIVLDITVWIFACQYAKIKNQKYDRCKVIEEKIGFRQHRDVSHPPGFQRVLYAIVMLIFLFTWGAVLWEIW
jgi:hypothetical protein